MGLNALVKRTDGEKIPASDNNQFVDALIGDLVPRNNSAVVEDIFGQLGTSALRWLRAYVQTYHIGNAANNLTISEGAANEIHIKRGGSAEEIRIRNGSIELYIAGVLKGKFDSNGLDGSLIKTQSIAYASIEAKPVIQAGPANGNVGGTLNSIGSNEITTTLVSGKKYIFSYRAQNLQTSDTLRMNVDPPSSAEVELEALQFSATRGTEGGFMYYETVYTAPESGSFVFKIYARNWTNVTNGYSTVREA